MHGTRLLPCDWVIVKTAYKREAYVASRIKAMGFDAVVPVECFAVSVSRHSKAKKIEERPAIPGALFAALPVAVHGELGAIRHYHSLQRDLAAQPYLIPHWQVMRFLGFLEEHNETVRKLAREKKPVDPRRVWRKFEPETLAEVLNDMFGISERAVA